jgi:hypothetical protein
MKIYFSKVPAGYDDSEVFNFKGDNFYSNVEYGTNPGGLDEIMITDSVGRSMPVCVEDITDLITILMIMREAATAATVATDMLDYINGDSESSI